MNCLWPVASRISCAQYRNIFSTRHKFYLLTQQLLSSSTHPYSTTACLWKDVLPRSSPLKTQEPEHINGQTTEGNGIYANGSTRVITTFEDLPQDYEDENGLPPTIDPLRKEDVFAIFGKGSIDTHSANRLLSVLHGRRVAGTLPDPDAPGSLNVHEERARQIGLAWLRENVPVDEIRSAGLQAEKELAELQADLVADSERIGIWMPNRSKPGNGNSVYGKSVLEAVREQNERDHEERAKAREAQAAEIRHNTGELEVASPRSDVVLRRPGENSLLKYYLEKSKVLPDEPPQMSALRRVGPSALLVLGIVLGCLIFSQVYKPPKRSARLMPDIPPAVATITGIFLINLGVFALWHHPPAYRLLNKYFITVPGYVYPLSLLGNTFSHQQFSHFAFNMLILFPIGTALHNEIGRGNFIAVYLASGSLASFVSLSAWVLRGSLVSSSLGASGAISGVVGTYLWLNGMSLVTLFGLFPPDFLPLPSIVLVAILMGVEIWGISRWNRMPGNMDHWAHIGGYSVGIGAAELLRMKARRRKASEDKKRQNEGFSSIIREGKV